MIYLITGGARSGKSRYASELALSLSDSPVYIATARRWDDEFEQRIARHVADRDEHWTTIEEETEVSKHNLSGRVVVVDCVTLWLSNLFTDYGHEIEESLNFFKKEIDALAASGSTYIIVTNELGMGVHAETAIGRKFTDLQGWANQYAAKMADEVFLMVAGIAMRVK